MKQLIFKSFCFVFLAHLSLAQNKIKPMFSSGLMYRTQGQTAYNISVRDYSIPISVGFVLRDKFSFYINYNYSKAPSIYEAYRYEYESGGLGFKYSFLPQYKLRPFVKLDFTNQLGVNSKTRYLGISYVKSNDNDVYYYSYDVFKVLVATKSTKILSFGCDYSFFDKQLFLGFGGGFGSRKLVWKYENPDIPVEYLKSGTDRIFTYSLELALTYIFNFKKKKISE